MTTSVITLGGGCFWCLDAVFRKMKGVIKVESGYSGGKTEDPTYEQICTGRTGHAEVVQITYDTTILPLEELLNVFLTRGPNMSICIPCSERYVKTSKSILLFIYPQ